MYNSPIEVIYQDIQYKLEKEILKACQTVNVNVDKEELIKALQYDRNQYEQGYNDALKNISMNVVDLKTGYIHKYGDNPHDCLITYDEGKTLSYLNLQNGDGSRYGDYRIICDNEENIINIGGFRK